MASIELKQVYKDYGAVKALQDVTLSIRAGEHLAVVGPSGCGKTTLLRLLAGLERPDRGTVCLNDAEVSRLSSFERDVAMVFQNGALYPHLTVAENLAFGLRARSVAAETIRSRIQDVAEILGITDLLKRRPAALSGGQRQRVALGRAWVREPSLFLLDEPLTHVDAHQRDGLRRALVFHLEQRAQTTVYVTHDQAEALTVGKRVAVLADGRLLQVGSPEEVYEHPQNRFVAGFVGVPAMNFLAGRFRPDSPLGPCFQTGDGDIPLPSVARTLQRVDPEELVLGVRPQDLRLVMQEAAGGIAVKVEQISFQGGYHRVSLRTPSGFSLLACVATERLPQVGSTAVCTVDSGRLCLFRPGLMGENLLL